MTAWWLPADCSMTAWWLPDDCLMTAWWLPNNHDFILPVVWSPIYLMIFICNLQSCTPFSTKTCNWLSGIFAASVDSMCVSKAADTKNAAESTKPPVTIFCNGFFKKLQNAGEKTLQFLICCLLIWNLSVRYLPNQGYMKRSNILTKKITKIALVT